MLIPRNFKLGRLLGISLFLLAAGIFFHTRFSFAADITWTGATSSDWSVSTNWSTNTIPTSSDNVTIPDASTTSNDPDIANGAVCNNLTINANGVLNGNAQTITVYGNWTNNGVFNHGNGTVKFGGSSHKAFAPGLSEYFNLELNRGNEYILTVSGTATVLSNLTQTNGSFGGGQINLAGNYIINAGSDGGPYSSSSTVINFNGTGDQQITFTPGGVGCQVRIDKASGTFYVNDNIVICGWTYVQGTVMGLNTYTLIFGDNFNGNFTPGNLVYNNMELKKTGYDTLGVSGTGTISGNIIHTSGEFQGGQLNLGGNYIVSSGAKGGSIYGASTVINFNHATNNQTIVYSAGGTAAQVRIDKTGGTFAVNDNIVICGWTYVQGTVTGLDTYTLVFGDNYNGNFTPGNLVYGNIELNKTGYDNLGVTGTGTISGNIIHTNGQFGGGQLNLAGNYIIGASADGGADSSVPTVVNFNGTGDQGIIYSAGGNGTAIRIDKTSGTLTIPATLSVSGWNYVQGTVVGIDSCSLRLGGVFHNSFYPGNLTYGDIQIVENGAYTNFTISGNLNMNGDFTLTQGNLRLDSNNPSINIGGDLTIAAGSTFTKGTGIVTFVGTSPSTFTDLSSSPQNVGKIALNKTSSDESNNVLTLLSNMLCNTFAIDGTAESSDTLNLGNGGYVMTIANVGVIADVFVVGGAVIPGNSTIRYAATNSAGNINIAPVSYNHLELSGNETYALTGTTTVNGHLTIGAASILSAGVNTLNLSGNLLNSGTFNANTSTLNLTGTSQSLFGNTSFYNLAKTVSSDDTLTFAASSTTSILSGGSLTLNGQSESDLLSLRSSSSSTAYNINVSASANTNLNYLSVADSNATGTSLTANNSISGGGNTNWIITSVAPFISETVPVPSYTTNVTPSYTFSSTKEGTITYAGDCSSSVTVAAIGSNTIIFNILSEGTYSNCSIKVTDILGNESNVLSVSSFTIDATFPTAPVPSSPNGPVSSDTPTFSWADSIDSSGIEKYQLYIDGILDQDNLAATSAAASNKLSCGDHSWYVVATDLAGQSTISTSVNFTISCGFVFLPPQKPVITLSDLQNATLPPSVKEIAISNNPDFKEASFQEIDLQKLRTIPQTNSTLYLRFRSREGGVSDTLIIHPASSAIQDGDIIQCQNSDNPYAVYIVKTVNNKKYIRHIVSLSIFNHYQHLRWENLKQVDSLESFNLSAWVRVNTGANGQAGPKDRVYEINADQSKHFIDMTQEEFFQHGGSEEAIYNINTGELNLYRQGEAVKVR